MAGKCLLPLSPDSELLYLGFSLSSFSLPQCPSPPHSIYSFATGFEEPITFRITQISIFYNNSWEQTLASGWLDELQTHRWESNSSTIIFLRAWSRGNFSNKELKDNERFYHVYLVRLHQAIQTFASILQVKYPFELQVTTGCELRPGKPIVNFLRGAYRGLDFMSFQNNSWVPSPEGGSRAQLVCQVLNRYLRYKDIAQQRLSDDCPRFILGLIDAGKAYLQQQVKPEAWLSSGPSPGPGRLLLVCHVSGFYPKPVWVMWMRGAQEEPGTQQGDVLPNADGTWYLQATLDVDAREAAGLACRVKHSSLEGQDIILYWGEKELGPGWK
ncbi:T-cell surface glycoprotein CD1a-like, partial [Carlito syrichta]|uniref:T-cell surface glycoprotein CD1a-like n=1 Tax=Carlito syrichta TaxID=1868482 RepID=A0A3Q0DSV3_CARSF